MPKKPSPKITKKEEIRLEPGEQIWFNPTEAAQYVGLSRETIYRLMDEGKLPYQTFAGVQKRRIKKEDLDKLFKMGKPSRKDGD